MTTEIDEKVDATLRLVQQSHEVMDDLEAKMDDFEAKFGRLHAEHDELRHEIIALRLRLGVTGKEVE